MQTAPAKVYYVKEITPENLIKIYDALGVELQGNVGVKVSTGEAGSRGYLKPELIGPLVQKLNGTIIECNTAYAGQRNTATDHLRVAAEHGFTKIANVDIMDADGEMKIPVHNGKHLKYNLVGTHLDNYDSILNLAHGKGHAMGGFGANLKNQSIGIASRNGKAYIHSAGFTTDPDLAWSNLPQQQAFIESMAEAAKSVSDYFASQNKQIVYITVMNFLSVDCDCDAHQTDPVMADLGIIASTDPVANDQADFCRIAPHQANPVLHHGEAHFHPPCSGCRCSMASSLRWACSARASTRDSRSAIFCRLASVSDSWRRSSAIQSRRLRTDSFNGLMTLKLKMTPQSIRMIAATLMKIYCSGRPASAANESRDAARRSSFCSSFIGSAHCGGCTLTYGCCG